MGEARDRGRSIGRRAGARQGARGAQEVANITWKKGELEKLPIESGSMDVALLSQALHHAAEPAQALDEAARILKPGGRLLILDLRPHDEAWVREKLGDRWFGFSDEHLRGLLRRAGFTDVTRRARRAAHQRSVCRARWRSGRTKKQEAE